ncbi:MAG: hypothetical protein AAF184_09505 [Pseudomonadota bacterium]
MAVFDARFLMRLLHPDSSPPPFDDADLPVDRVRERIDCLIRCLEAAGEKIVVPAPALGELLVLADESGPAYLGVMQQSSQFEIAPFGERAAVEWASMVREIPASAVDGCDGEATVALDTRLAMEIVAIARAAGQETIYTDDRALKTAADRRGLRSIGMHALPLE